MFLQPYSIKCQLVTKLVRRWLFKVLIANLQLILWIFQEQLKSGSQGSKRKERAQSEDEEGEHSEKKRRKGGKKKKRDKSEKSHYEEVEADRVEYQEDMDEPHSDYGEPNQLNTAYDDREDHAQDPLAAVGLEDSDAEDDMVISKFHC